MFHTFRHLHSAVELLCKSTKGQSSASAHDASIFDSAGNDGKGHCCWEVKFERMKNIKEKNALFRTHGYGDRVSRCTRSFNLASKKFADFGKNKRRTNASMIRTPQPIG